MMTVGEDIEPDGRPAQLVSQGSCFGRAAVGRGEQFRCRFRVKAEAGSGAQAELQGSELG